MRPRGIGEPHDSVEVLAAAEAAEAVGMDPKRLGTLLGRAGVKARSVHRGGKKARRYTLDMKEKIEKKS